MLRRRNAGCLYLLQEVENQAGCIATAAGRVSACRLPQIAFHNTLLCAIVFEGAAALTYYM